MVTRISIAQMNIDLGQTKKNLDKGVQAIQSTAQDHSSLILLPELWTTGFDLDQVLFHAQTNKVILTELQKLSDALQISIVGSYLLCFRKKVFNTLVFIQPLKKPASYKKIHLFPGMTEDSSLSPGHQRKMVEHAGWMFGLAVCFDLRFPDLFWNYSHAGTNAFILPAQWPLSRIAQWDILSRSRAVENQSFFIGCNTVGLINNERFGGSSCVINPDGSYAAHAGTQNEELLTADLDIEKIVRIRSQFPILQHS